MATDAAARSSPEDDSDLWRFLPDWLTRPTDPQKEIPRLAKDSALTRAIESTLGQIPTTHHLYCQDAREMVLPPESVHLVLTSPPYWTLKEYRPAKGQLGHVADYERFLAELDKVWQRCYQALTPGGRLICIVGDVCLSRRKNEGRHTVIPLHASIQEHCRAIGFDNLAPIIWHKIANAQLEAEGNGSSFLGKPYEPNAVIKNDIEFVLMQRKPGGYRTPDLATRLLSIISDTNHKIWFQQIWTGLTGASTRHHPAPFPLELAMRLIRMFSFVGDTVLDPFAGTGTTMLAAAQCGRNSIGVEVDPSYFDYARRRIAAKTSGLFATATLQAHSEADSHERSA
ncbi:MAG TPA: site-specific DNA-methyltransferase [Gemmataceae bacterium]|nr:site-specific DNA-methyltransferase [Gemmataceae bacterium]